VEEETVMPGMICGRLWVSGWPGIVGVSDQMQIDGNAGEERTTKDRLLFWSRVGTSLFFANHTQYCLSSGDRLFHCWLMVFERSAWRCFRPLPAGGPRGIWGGTKADVAEPEMGGLTSRRTSTSGRSSSRTSTGMIDTMTWLAVSGDVGFKKRTRRDYGCEIEQTAEERR